MVELQDFERSIETALPEGQQVADPYLAFLFDRCQKASGKIFVADWRDTVIGFVGVLAHVVPEEPDEDPRTYAYISDLVVLPSYRHQGIGRRLLQRAEVYARAQGAKVLRVGVLAQNGIARDLYGKLGFVDYQVQLIKNL